MTPHFDAQLIWINPHPYYIFFVNHDYLTDALGGACTTRRLNNYRITACAPGRKPTSRHLQNTKYVLNKRQELDFEVLLL